jgi:hypothetical protein
MKIIPKLCLLALILATTFSSNAQVNRATRPYLFAHYSSKIPASVTELDKAFTAKTGSTVKFVFSSAFTFSGTVISSVQKYNNLSSVLIKSPALNNALLSISKRINDDSTVTYVGRIINEKYADAYELVKDDAGNYSFTKIKTEDLVQDF